MIFKLHFILLFFIGINFTSCSQTTNDSTNVSEQKNPYEWQNLSPGLDLCEPDAPKKSFIGDSKLTVVRIDPTKFDFYLLTATEFGNKTRPINEWADTFQLNMAVNAGMYELSNGLINRGYMKNFNHLNNGTVNPGYNSMIALNPVDSTMSACAILDLQCNSWDNVKNDYNCYAQGMRMIDCNGQALGWNKRKQLCSMLVAATDPKGNIYYIFSRSPYTHNDMIQFILGLPFELSNAIYIEGGPETSLYIKAGDTIIQKVGSYVSDTYPNDDNIEFWNLPNVIGLKQK